MMKFIKIYNNLTYLSLDFKQNGSDHDILARYDYEPFGKRISVDAAPGGERLSFIGKEKDLENSLGDFGVRKYDEEIGRFTSTDPLFEKYAGWSPYHYCGNNPVSMLDPSGMDEEQRNEALEKANEYLKSNSTYELGEKGEPGKPVDCSGMVSKCIVAGGEADPVSDPKNTGTGVQRIEQGTKKIDSENIVGGIIVTFRTSGWGFHTGIVSKVNKDNEGNVVSFVYIHANSTNDGVSKSEKKIDDKQIHGFYKWDTKPDRTETQNDIIKGQNSGLIPPTVK